MIRIASYNVENLFARPKAFKAILGANNNIIEAYNELNIVLDKQTYSNNDKNRIKSLFLTLDLYYRNTHGAIRRKRSSNPKWAWFRRNKGKFDREPGDKSQDVEVTATGRKDWLGWVDLAVEPVKEKSVRMTARVIKEVNADILGIVEAEDRPSLIRFNQELLDGFFNHVMLVDGNDERGIDVGILSKTGFPIESIVSNVDTNDNVGEVFNRDCPQYEVKTPSGQIIHVLVNHFKSQSGGGGSKRRRQANEVRRIVDELIERNQHVIVLGDLNEGPQDPAGFPDNFNGLFGNESPMIDCFQLPNFDTGSRPGTFDSCGIRNRLDYVLISKSLRDHFEGGEIFRKGLWGKRKTRPDNWETYNDMNRSVDQASDHALIYIDLDL